MPQSNDVKAPDAKAKALITDKWLKAVKKELAALKHPDDCEWQQLVKNVQGCYLGDVNDHRVFAVVANQVMRHCAMDWTTGGNHEKWPFVPKRQLWLSHSLEEDECQHDGLHEAVEQHLMSKLGYSYDAAHAIANWYEKQYMEELDVGGPAEKDAKDDDDDAKEAKPRGKVTIMLLPWGNSSIPAKSTAGAKKSKVPKSFSPLNLS